ncbi:hypothetical protein [Ensifer sp. KUDG1]|uniref:hypothetical protein n=1 Tax=Ensifer sp. KUDG1 TaxID=3373919 RepID=UPI003D1D8518
MPSCRIFLAAFFWPAVLLVTTLPYKFDLTRAGLSITETAALAKNGNNGGGNGGGNGGNGGGNSGGNGNGGGNNGNGNGNGGGNGNGNGNSNENRSGGNSKASRSSEDADDEGEGEAGIRHKGGITEQVRKGRYIMKDARGRTIINRRATSADKQRMQTFAH